jgi:hypothetical protein
MLKNDFTFLLYNVLTVGIPIRVWIQTVLLLETLGSGASLLAATLYQGNPDRNHKL